MTSFKSCCFKPFSEFFYIFFLIAGGHGNGQVHCSPVHGQAQVLQAEQDLCRVSRTSTQLMNSASSFCRFCFNPPLSLTLSLSPSPQANTLTCTNQKESPHVSGNCLVCSFIRPAGFIRTRQEAYRRSSGRRGWGVGGVRGGSGSTSPTRGSSLQPSGL